MPLDEMYLVWLYSQVGEVDNKNRAKSYWKLLKILYRKEFTWTKDFDLDGNRAQDGKDLRSDFLRDTGTRVSEPGWLDLPCSMLELFIALSVKLAWEGEGDPADWFWDLMKNLELDGYTDAHPPDEVIVNHTLDKVINRDYSKNGAGGLFPLSRPKKDQRDVELWIQANAYLLERF